MRRSPASHARRVSNSTKFKTNQGNASLAFSCRSDASEQMSLLHWIHSGVRHRLVRTTSSVSTQMRVSKVTEIIPRASAKKAIVGSSAPTVMVDIGETVPSTALSARTSR